MFNHKLMNSAITLVKPQYIRYATCSRQTIRDSSEIPHPWSLPVLGTALPMLATGGATKLHLYVDKRHKQLGPIFRDKIGPVTGVFVSDADYQLMMFRQEGKYPEHMLPEAWVLYNEIHGNKRGLFFLSDEEWLKYRRLMNGCMLKGDLDYIEKSCEIVSQQLVRRLEVLSTFYEVIPNVERILYMWSSSVLISVLLGHESYQSNSHRLINSLDSISSKMHLIFMKTVPLQLISAKLARKLKLPIWSEFENVVGEVVSAANLLVKDLLQKYPLTEGLLSKMLALDVPLEMINRIVTDFLLAAGDTTAYTMDWALYLISKNRHVQETLREELKTDSSPQLLKNIVRETLRLYPVAPFITRYLPKEAVIGGYVLPKDTLVLMSAYTSSRDPKYFKNPEEFLPNRWLRDGQAANETTRKASLPFAMGSRSCIGKKIAEAQLCSALAAVVKNFDVHLRNQKSVEMQLNMVSVPSEPIQLSFQKL